MELSKVVVEKLKRLLFDDKVPKDVATARTTIINKSKTYYSSEALNPRPKRGRPPKQILKVEVEPEFALDIYTTVPSLLRPFLYIPDIATASSVTFSSKFETEEQLLASLRGSSRIIVDEKLEALSQRLESLKQITDRLSTEKSSQDSRLQPPLHAPMKDEHEIGLAKGKEKMSSAVGSVLPKKSVKTKGKDEAEEFTPEKRKRFSVKQVTPIKSPKKP